ncbi:hypothetical protein [Pseudomonas sp. Pdm06]|uniref:hypothetical protein n=1 Tax=Pseudomonas sp. Pdm06 TaxID=1790044 RepID=UPI001CE154BE|nr:hypothetical protein [Pseudomonas sp. Pdm06]
MKNAVELLQQYLDAIQTPYLAAALFAEDGVLELPYLESLGIPHSVKGPAAIEGLLAHCSVKCRISNSTMCAF